MLLSQYQSLTTSLIQTPQSPIPLISTSALTTYINLGRSRVAAEAECVRGTGTATSVAPGSTAIAYTALVPGNQVITARSGFLGGQKIDIRPWDWYQAYFAGGQPPPTSPVGAHFPQGVASFFYLASQNGGALTLDVIMIPPDLVDDTTPDAIPYPWEEAVPFYAAFRAYMDLQRQADATLMMARYREQLRDATAMATSSNLPEFETGGVAAQLASTHIPLTQPIPAQGGR